MNDNQALSRIAAGQEEVVYAVLSRVAATLGVPAERSELDLQAVFRDDSEADLAAAFTAGAKQLGLAVKETEIRDAREIFELVSEGLPVIAITMEDQCRLIRRVIGRRLEVNVVSSGEMTTATMTRGELKKLLVDKGGLRLLVAKEELVCDAISSAPGHHSSHQHGHRHLSPMRRFLGLLRMDAGDVWTVALFALVAGALGLATPLAVESLVNVVSWGIYIQPLLILAIILLTCLGISATLNVLQTIVVEIIQRRQLVRIVSDLAHRFPRANREHLSGEFPRELANRVFDIMTIQKATATLMLDGMSILLTTFLGLLLLAFYHPFLLGFDIVLLISMISITWLLGRGGVRTAIQESITKYRIAHWLQDLLDFPAAFRVNGGEAMAIDRASRLATEYVQARKRQFRVVLRQVIFAVGLQVVASTALLGLGGWLVIQGQLTLGQLVASELVVTVVVGAFSKAGKSLEKFYDLMAGVDKVGHLLDIPTDPHDQIAFPPDTALEIKWDELLLESGDERCTLPAQELKPGSSTAILSTEHMSLIMDALAGLEDPKVGLIEVGGIDTRRLAVGCHQGQAIGYASKPEVFRGSVSENVALGRSCVGRGRVREVLQQIGLWDEVGRLENGLDTVLQTGGYPLSETQIAKLMLARAIAGRPGVVLVNGLLDVLSEQDRTAMRNLLQSPDNPWTAVIGTRLNSLASQCENCIELE